VTWGFHAFEGIFDWLCCTIQRNNQTVGSGLVTRLPNPRLHFKTINMSKTANGNGDTEFNDEDIDFSDIEAKYGLFFKLI
jgi:hypothetical protein